MSSITSKNSTCCSSLTSRNVAYLSCRHHLCGYDLNLTYPQIEPFPTLNFTSGLKAALNRAAAHASRRSARTWKDTFLNELAARQGTSRRSVDAIRSVKRLGWKRDISGPTGIIDFWYGCDIFDEMTDYALNFTAPWSKLLRTFMGLIVY